MRWRQGSAGWRVGEMGGGSGSAGLRSVVSRIKARVVEGLVHLDPLGASDPVSGGCARTSRKCACDHDRPVLIGCNFLNFCNNFVQVLILAEYDRHIKLPFSGERNKIKRLKKHLKFHPVDQCAINAKERCELVI